VDHPFQINRRVYSAYGEREVVSLDGQEKVQTGRPHNHPKRCGVAVPCALVKGRETPWHPVCDWRY